jgi:branched-subunit amino acid aminotransferase/4-amino-4-deoxychorismate lyase
MAEPVVYINEKQVDYRQASVSVFDYTLHCAIGFFESILAVDDRLVLADEHLDRMETGLGRLGLKLNYNRTRILRTLHRAAKEHPGHVKKIKILLTYGYFPLWPGSRPGPKTIINVLDHRLQFKKQKLLVSPMVISSADPMRGIKSLNFMTEWMSQKHAHDAGYDQGIIVNQEGFIAETGSASIFMVRRGQLSTPALEVGGLPGTIRREIIRIATANNIVVREKKLTPKELVTGDEIFTTSSFKLVWPVVAVKLDKVYRFVPGPLSRALFNLLKINFLTGLTKTNLNF